MCAITTNCLCRSLEISGCTDALYQRHVKYFNESFRLAVEHRLVHEYDGKAPPQLPLNSPVPESEPVMSTSTDVHTETKVASSTSKQQQPQQSAMADARGKFEQVLQASRQAAASTAAGSTSVHEHRNKKLPTTDNVVVADVYRNHANKLTSSLLYSQLVCML